VRAVVRVVEATMARDLARLTRDIQFFISGQPGTGFRGFGSDSLYFSDDGQFLFLPGVSLPEVYRQSQTPVLIVVPDGYGYGVPMTDVFVDAGLETRRGKRPSRLFTGMDSMLPGGASMPERLARLARLVHYPGLIPELGYLCIHSSADVSLWEYLEQIQIYLSRPVG
jgi:hypothetical protein